MKTENKVRAHITSPKSEDQIEECDLVVAFGISGHEDSIELQTFCVGSTIGGSATMLALARGIINAIDIIAKDHFDAIILQKFFIVQFGIFCSTQMMKISSHLPREKSNDTADYF